MQLALRRDGSSGHLKERAVVCIGRHRSKGVVFALAYEIRTGVNVISAPSDVDPPSTKVWLTGGRPGGAISTQSKLLGFLSNAEGGGVRAGWKPAVRQTPTAPLCCEQRLVALACVLDDPLSHASARFTRRL